MKLLISVNLFRNLKNAPTTATNPAVTTKKTAIPLEKISYKQNRNYQEEARQAQLNKRAPELADKQPTCYNYNKPFEFPNLFKGWLQSEGDQIAKQVSIKVLNLLNR